MIDKNDNFIVHCFIYLFHLLQDSIILLDFTNNLSSK